MQREEMIEFLKSRPLFEPEMPMGIVEDHEYSVVSRPSFVAIAVDGGEFEEIPKNEIMTIDQICEDAQYYINHQEFDSARECIECGLKLDAEQEKKSWRVYYLAGIIAMQKKIYDEAVNFIKTSLELGCPELRISYDCMAVSASILGRQKEAFEYYQMAIKQTPEDPEAWSNLAGFYWDNGMQKDAAAAYTKALELDIHYIPIYEEMRNLTEKMGNKELSLRYAAIIDEKRILTQDILDQTKEWLSGLMEENEGMI